VLIKKTGVIIMQGTISMLTAKCNIRDVRLSDDEQILAAMACPEVASMHSGGFVDNPASGRVLEKAGMSYEGTLRLYNGRSDEKMYAVINTDMKGANIT
jgi:hypothetical protein